jgi:hypothetical protein
MGYIYCIYDIYDIYIYGWSYSSIRYNNNKIFIQVVQLVCIQPVMLIIDSRNSGPGYNKMWFGCICRVLLC